jgi:hypothetical protein
VHEWLAARGLGAFAVAIVAKGYAQMPSLVEMATAEMGAAACQALISDVGMSRPADQVMNETVRLCRYCPVLCSSL